MNEISVIIAACLVTFAAGFAQGLTGFGFALIAMPLLAGTIGLQSAVVVIVGLSLVTNIAILAPVRKEVQLKEMRALIIASMAAVPAGAWLLLVAPAPVLKTAAGVLVAGFALLQLRGTSFPIGNRRLAYPVAGALSGILNGSISLSGPPIALFLSAQGMDKHRFRANIALFSLILNVTTIGMFIAKGLLSVQELSRLASLCPAMACGVAAGIAAARRADERLFKRLILLFLTVSGIWTLAAGLEGLL